jgi:hypothetical protein
MILLVLTPYLTADGNLPRRVRASAPGKTPSAPPKPLNQARSASGCSARVGTGCGVLTAPASERNSSLECYLPADDTRTATVGSGDFGTSPLCFGSSQTSRYLPVSDHMGCGAQSAMAGENLKAEPLGCAVQADQFFRECPYQILRQIRCVDRREQRQRLQGDRSPPKPCAA